jgi:glyoxylase-like metal-dependent hydrolase (beta-lactamase superfamily II)
MEQPPEPGGFITDKQIIKFGNTELVALHVPGHSPGSLAFYNEEKSSVFTGDALFAGSIGRTDLPGGDYDTLINSITSKLFVLPKDTVVYSGHGRNTTIESEINSNPFFA